MERKYVYHSSHLQSLKQIEPKLGTHQEEWVYAAKDKVMSAIFITGTGGGDFVYAKGRDKETGKVYICERIEGAFKKLYENVSGAIYTLAAGNFHDGRTGWSEEVISVSTEIPIEEVKIENMLDYIAKLEERGELIVKRFPERLQNIPEDDGDILIRALVWSKQVGDRILDSLKQMHPSLYDDVQKMFSNEEYFCRRADELLTRYPMFADLFKDAYPKIYEQITEEV